MAEQNDAAESNRSESKPPIRWTGVIFGLAANLLLVTVADIVTVRLQADVNLGLLATMVAPILAGGATALYVGQRGGMHAFIGGMLSVPILALFVFQGVWQFAIFAGAFCTLGGSLTEIYLRQRTMG